MLKILRDRMNHAGGDTFLGQIGCPAGQATAIPGIGQAFGIAPPAIDFRLKRTAERAGEFRDPHTNGALL